MIDPFNAWSRMISAGLEMQSTLLQSVEAMQASRSVIGTRTEMIRAAAAAPLTGNYAELSRMAPEKVAAFSRSALTVAGDTFAMHSAWATQMQRVGRMMLCGRMPTVAEAATLMSQSTDYALGAMTAGAQLGKDALAPVHRTVTDNARRLARKKRTSR